MAARPPYAPHPIGDRESAQRAGSYSHRPGAALLIGRLSSSSGASPACSRHAITHQRPSYEGLDPVRAAPQGRDPIPLHPRMGRKSSNELFMPEPRDPLVAKQQHSDAKIAWPARPNLMSSHKSVIIPHSGVVSWSSPVNMRQSCTHVRAVLGLVRALAITMVSRRGPNWRTNL
jgi:hypothetical protein